MSELARRRDAHEVWVSRSHLQAAAAGAALLAIAAFVGGFLAGRHQAFTAVEAARSERTLVGDVPGRDLLALLAEVERSAVPSASAAVVYPDLLRGNGEAPLPSEPAAVPVTASIPAPPVAAAFQGDPVPGAPYTVQVGQYATEAEARGTREHLKGRGLDAWWTLERVDGAAQYTVSVGGFGTPEAAAAALAGIVDAARAGPVAGAAPHVVSLRGASAAVVPEAPTEATAAPEAVAAPVEVAAPASPPSP